MICQHFISFSYIEDMCLVPGYHMWSYKKKRAQNCCSLLAFCFFFCFCFWFVWQFLEQQETAQKVSEVEWAKRKRNSGKTFKKMFTKQLRITCFCFLFFVFCFFFCFVFLINIFQKNNTHNGSSRGSLKIDHRVKCYLKKVFFLFFGFLGILQIKMQYLVFLFCFVKSCKYKEQAGVEEKR